MLLFQFLLVFLAAYSHAHFQIIDAAVAGPEYSSLSRAHEVYDIARSQSANFVATCSYPFFWVHFDADLSKLPDSTLMVGGTVPVIERFWDVRVAAAVIGPGFPPKTATLAQLLPDEILDQIPGGMGVVPIPAVADQSTCDFTDDPLSTGVLTGQPPYTPATGTTEEAPFTFFNNWPSRRCFFHEEWGGSDMWVVQDELVPLTQNGSHYIVFWNPSDQYLGAPTHTAKFGVVFGDKGQSERFDGPTLDVGECSLPAPDFAENACHTAPAHAYIVGTNIPAPECKPFEGVPIPNYYECASAPTDIAVSCDSLCHNHGVCSAGSSDCSSAPAAELCSETCSWQMCGAGAKDFKQGPVGPGCPDGCAHPHLEFVSASSDVDQLQNTMFGHPKGQIDVSAKRLLFGSVQPACPAECTGDFTSHHDEEEHGGDGHDGDGDGSECPGDCPGAAYCKLIPGCDA